MAFFGNPADTISAFYDNFANTIAKKIGETNKAIADQTKIISSIEKKEEESLKYLKLIVDKKEGGSSAGGVGGTLSGIAKTAGAAAGISIISLGLLQIAKALKLIDNDVEAKALKFTLAVYYLMQSVQTIQEMKGLANPVKIYAAMEGARFIVYFAGGLINEINKVPDFDHGINGTFDIKNPANANFAISTKSKLFTTMIALMALSEILAVYEQVNKVFSGVSISSSVMYMLFGMTTSIITMLKETINAVNNLPELDHGITGVLDLKRPMDNEFKVSTKSKLFNVVVGTMALSLILDSYSRFLKALDSKVLNGSIANVILIRLITPWIIGTIRVALEEFQTLIKPATALMTGGSTDVGSIVGLGNTGIKIPNFLITVAAVSFALIPIATAFNSLATIPGVGNPLKMGMMYLTVPIIIATMGVALRAMNAIDIGPVTMQSVIEMTVKTFIMGQLAKSLIPVSTAFGSLLEVLVMGRKQALFSKIADAGIMRYVFGGKGLSAKEFFNRSGGDAKTSVIITAFAAIILTLFALVGVIAVLNLIPVSDPTGLVAKSLAVTILAYAMTPLMESFLTLYGTIWDSSNNSSNMNVINDPNMSKLFNKKEKKKMVLGKMPFGKIITTTIIAGVVTTAMAGVLALVMPHLFKVAGKLGSGKRVIALSIGIYFASLALGVMVSSFIKLYLMLNEVSSGGDRANTLTGGNNAMRGAMAKSNKKFNMMKDLSGFLKMMTVLPAFALGIVGVGVVFKIFSMIKPTSKDVPPMMWVVGVGFTLFVFAKIFSVVLATISKSKLSPASIAGRGKSKPGAGVSGASIGIAIATIIALSVGIVAVAMVMKFMPIIDPATITSMILMGIGLTFLAIPLGILALVISRLISNMRGIKFKKIKLSSLSGGNMLDTLGDIGNAVTILLAATLTIALITFTLRLVPIVSAKIPPVDMIVGMIPALLVIGLVALIITPIYKAVSEQGISKKMGVKGKMMGNIMNSPFIKVILILVLATIAIGMITNILGMFDWEKLSKVKPPSTKFIIGLIPTLLVIGLVAVILAVVSKMVKMTGLKSILLGGLILISAAGIFLATAWILTLMPDVGKLKILNPEWLKAMPMLFLTLGVIALAIGVAGMVAKLGGPTALIYGSIAVLGAAGIFLATTWILTFMPDVGKLKILSPEWLAAMPSLFITLGIIALAIGLAGMVAMIGGPTALIFGSVAVLGAAGIFLATAWILTNMPDNDKLKIFPKEWLENQRDVMFTLGLVGLIVSAVGVIAMFAGPVGIAMGAIAMLAGAGVILAIGYGLTFLPSTAFGAGSTFNGFVDSMVYAAEEITKMLIRVLNFGLVTLIDTFVYAMLKLFGLFGFNPNRDEEMARAALAGGGTVVMGNQVNITGNAVVNTTSKGFFEVVLDKIPEIEKLINVLSTLGRNKGIDIMEGLIAVSAGLSAFMLVMASGAILDVAESVLGGISNSIKFITGQSTEGEVKDPIQFISKLMDNQEKLTLVSQSLIGVAVGMGAIVAASKTSVSTKNIGSFMIFIDEFMSQPKITQWSYWDDNKQKFMKANGLNKLVAFSQVMKSIGGGLFGLVREDKKFMKIVKSFKELSLAMVGMVDAINSLQTDKLVSLNEQYDKIQQLADSNAIQKIEDQKSFATKTGELIGSIGTSLGIKKEKEEKEEKVTGGDQKLSVLTKNDLSLMIKDVAKKIVEEMAAKFGEASGTTALKVTDK